MLKESRIILKQEQRKENNRLPIAIAIHASRIHRPDIQIYRASVIYTNCFIGWNSYSNTK